MKGLVKKEEFGASAIGAQRLAIDKRIADLQIVKSDIDHRIKVLKNGFNALGGGENIMESKSLLAQEVRRIMSRKL